MSVAHSHPGPLPSPASVNPPPPLENGDRLDRAEFERRYDAMPELKKAELIGGIVFMGSPVRHRRHGRPHVYLAGWLAYYLAKTPGVDPSDNATMRLDDENEPQPDLLLRFPPAAGGQSKISEDDYIEGAVEFAAEIASSSVSIDTHLKLETYRRHGVREYLIWRVLDGAVDWFALRGDRYEPLKADDHTIIRSELFPGLWLDVPALLRGDLPTLFQLLDTGCATPEHAAFVEKLRAAPK
jgi:Uma2 family endonuclease